jgi:hypothetical protein
MKRPKSLDRQEIKRKAIRAKRYTEYRYPFDLLNAPLLLAGTRPRKTLKARG